MVVVCVCGFPLDTGQARIALAEFQAARIGKLGPESPWDNAKRLTAVVRQYVQGVTGVDLL